MPYPWAVSVSRGVQPSRHVEAGGDDSHWHMTRETICSSLLGVSVQRFTPVGPKVPDCGADRYPGCIRPPGRSSPEEIIITLTFPRSGPSVFDGDCHAHIPSSSSYKRERKRASMITMLIYTYRFTVCTLRPFFYRLLGVPGKTVAIIITHNSNYLFIYFSKKRQNLERVGLMHKPLATSTFHAATK